jgi:hypothetical protein
MTALDVDTLIAALPKDFGPFWDEVQCIDGMTEATFNRRRFAEAILARLSESPEPSGEPE